MERDDLDEFIQQLCVAFVGFRSPDMTRNFRTTLFEEIDMGQLTTAYQKIKAAQQQKDAAIKSIETTVTNLTANNTALTQKNAELAGKLEELNSRPAVPSAVKTPGGYTLDATDLATVDEIVKAGV
jgi:hypothetical protein